MISRRCLFVPIVYLTCAVFLQRGWAALPEAPSINGPFYGFGAHTTGGNNGVVVYVTSLADSGAGTLRAALSEGNRLVKFSVAGEIRLQSQIAVPSNVTIDGLSAPAPGISIRDDRISIIRDAHDVIVQGIRFRPAPYDNLRIAFGAHDVVVDHCSFTGSLDGALDITEGSHNVTVSWNIFTKTTSGKTMLISYGAYRISLHHNIFVENDFRNPVINSFAPVYYEQPIDFLAPTVDFRNNIVWNWTNWGSLANSYDNAPDWHATVNFVNNVFSSQSKPQNALVINSIDSSAKTQAYIDGNVRIGADQLPDINSPNNHAEFAAPAIGPNGTESALTEAYQTHRFAGVRPLDAIDEAAVTQIVLPPDTSDTEPPTLKIGSPSDAGSFVTDVEIVTLAGTASDNQQVSEVECVTDGETEYAAEGTDAWQVRDFPLHLWNNEIVCKAFDPSGNFADESILVTLQPRTLVIQTTSLDDAVVGSPYSNTLAASGGVAPYTWSIDNGALPGGLALNGTAGAISGVAVIAGEFPFTLKVTDTAGQAALADLAVSAKELMDITTAQLPAASVGVSYSASLAASGGQPPYRWSIHTGALPDGLALAADSGLISGIPGTRGSFSFNASVTDTENDTATENFELVVSGGTVPPSGTPQELTLQVAWREDDSQEVLSNGRNIRDAAKIYLGANLLAAYHFRDVTIPRGATILSATLAQYCDTTCGTRISIAYLAELAADAAPFTSNTFDLSQRRKTSTMVFDEPASWNRFAFNDSPDLKAVIQQIVDQAGWQTGNALNLFAHDVDSSKTRTINHFERNPNNGATLQIHFIAPGQ